MESDEAPRGLRRFDGTTLGLAQPVLRGGQAVAVLAVAWTQPRRGLPERARSVALLFAAEASLALDRAEQAAKDRERQALEINDNIVQGLVVAKYSAQRGNVEAAIEALDDTLVRARKLISDQLADVVSGRGIQPGTSPGPRRPACRRGLARPRRRLRQRRRVDRDAVADLGRVAARERHRHGGAAVERLVEDQASRARRPAS
jgi:hypothetical protein